jgi:hypothetical protein
MKDKELCDRFFAEIKEREKNYGGMSFKQSFLLFIFSIFNRSKMKRIMQLVIDGATTNYAFKSNL